MCDFPVTVRGLETYDKTRDFFLHYPLGPICFVPRDIAMVASDGVAVASCLIHCEGISAGPTGPRKVDGEWTILHEHHSLPVAENRYIGPDSRR